MQTAKIVQAVALLMIVAITTSCTATKQYTSKIFPGKQFTEKDTQAVALRFLELDKINPNEENMVSTDIIMGRDTVSNTLVLDNFSKEYPASNEKSDSSLKTIKDKEIIAANKKEVSVPVVEEPIARSTNANGVRTKKTRDDQ